MNRLRLIITFTICILNISFLQTESKILKVPPNTGSRYVSGEDGIIRMYVNVWGHVQSPGRILVDDGIDLATLLSLTGGPYKGAKLKSVLVYHEYPFKDGKDFHIIDLTEFIKTGDRSNFINIQPNDTFIIKQTAWSYIIEEINSINTFMNLINIYLNLTNLP
ncbi:uncharacterized protein METZ01_LOCUS312038 [marine metagenome]|uniref:Soluble ligand binding domain-containing protein n=1 Tax=marine metagenome TaxID=408172 RepID=A0A382ND98_9ZZZZ